jgi:tetratricopeptide (TPR) repeat protein
LDIETSLAELKTLVEKKDPVQVKKLATEISIQARDEAAEPAPAAESDKEAWKTKVDRAKEIDLYTEYALSATALQSEPAAMVDLLATLEQQNPKSKYLEDAYLPYFAALTKTGAAAKIPAVAEKALANWPTNPDILLFLADSAYQAKKYDRAATLGSRLIAAGGKKATPAVLGHAYFITGMSYYLENNFPSADKTLRASLTYLKGGDVVSQAYAYYGLCVSNYQLGRQSLSKATMLEGASFCDQAARLKSPVAQQAWSNAHMIRTEAEARR